MTANEPVHKSVFYPIFTEIRGVQRQDLKIFLNVKNINNVFGGNYISFQRFEQLQSFVESIDNSGFSSIKEYVVDNLHSQMWLLKINEYMKSVEYQADPKNKNRIIEQQKLIYKTVNQ